MDLNHLLMEIDPTLATFVIVAIIAALVMGVWQLVKSLSSKDRVVVAATPRDRAAEIAAQRHDMRTLSGVPLEAGS